MSFTLLISSAGRRAELLNCFREDAELLGLGLRVLATDVDPAMSAACQLADASFAVPRCTDAGFIPQLLEICRRERVDLLVPTIDPELLPLAEARAAFAAVGTRVVVSAPEVVAIARDKLRTAFFLAQAGVPAPRTALLATLMTDENALRFPVILKRVDGSSSIGLHEAADAGAMDALVLDTPRYIAQEKWIGREYTVNIFFDRAGRLRAAVPHERCATRAGEVSKGRTARVPRLRELAEKIAAALPGAAGPLCFQAIVTEKGDVAVFEINARFGGGFPLAHRAGARFTRWLLEEMAGRPDTAADDWREGMTMLRYDAAVFLPGGTPP